MVTNVTPTVELDKESEHGKGNLDSFSIEEPAVGSAEPTAETPKRAGLLRNSLGRFSSALQQSARGFNDIAGSHLSASRIPYGAYILRAAGLLVATFGVFSPIIESNLPGMAGWFVDLLINVIVGIVLFMIAEIAQTTREISETLKSGADKHIVEQRIDTGESRLEGY